MRDPESDRTDEPRSLSGVCGLWTANRDRRRKVELLSFALRFRSVVAASICARVSVAYSRIIVLDDDDDIIFDNGSRRAQERSARGSLCIRGARPARPATPATPDTPGPSFTWRSCGRGWWRMRAAKRNACVASCVTCVQRRRAQDRAISIRSNAPHDDTFGGKATSARKEGRTRPKRLSTRQLGLLGRLCQLCQLCQLCHYDQRRRRRRGRQGRRRRICDRVAAPVPANAPHETVGTATQPH